MIKFGLLNDTKPYAIPNQGSLTDPKLQQLLRRPSDTLRFQQDDVIKRLLDAEHLVHVIMDYGDPTFLPPIPPGDCHVLIWVILRQYGSGSMRRQNVQRFPLTLPPSPWAIL